VSLNINLFTNASKPSRLLLDRLGALFKEMDRAYAAVAGQYGFQCNGCADNCCLTRFHHHTLIEYVYLMEGMQTLATGVQKKIDAQASAVCEALSAADRRGEPLRIMCPLNLGGQCLLYTYRPMICRLHGIPHELQRPGGGITCMPGCDAFFDQCRRGGKTDYIRFDRTPLYRRMALLEKEMRQATGYTAPIKLTVAEMLATRTENAYEID